MEELKKLDKESIRIIFNLWSWAKTDPKMQKLRQSIQETGLIHEDENRITLLELRMLFGLIGYKKNDNGLADASNVKRMLKQYEGLQEFVNMKVKSLPRKKRQNRNS